MQDNRTDTCLTDYNTGVTLAFHLISSTLLSVTTEGSLNQTKDYYIFHKKQPMTFKAIQTTERNPQGQLVPHSAASDYHTRQ